LAQQQIWLGTKAPSSAWLSKLQRDFPSLLWIRFTVKFQLKFQLNSSNNYIFALL